MPDRPARTESTSAVMAFRCIRCHRLSYSPSGNCEHGVPDPLVLRSHADVFAAALAHVRDALLSPDGDDGIDLEIVEQALASAQGCTP